MTRSATIKLERLHRFLLLCSILCCDTNTTFFLKIGIVQLYALLTTDKALRQISSVYVLKWKKSKNEEAALHIQVTLTEQSNVESYLELTKQISTVYGSTKRSQGNKKNSEKYLQH